MAKAYFNCHACGYSVAVVGRNRADADRLAEYRTQNEALCHDCWSQQRAEERAETSQQAAETAAHIGLPVLQGSEKQIAWAETLRRDNLARFEKLAEGLEGEQAALMREVGEAIRSQDKASWWINTRSEYWWHERYAFAVWLLGGSQYLKLSADEQMARTRAYMGGLRQTEPAAKPSLVADAMAEATVRPAHPVTATAAEFKQVGQQVRIAFPVKDDVFRKIVKGCGYRWCDLGYWRIDAGPTMGIIEDRLIEAAHGLLAAGFPVIIQDDELRRRAIEGDFEPRHTRWVSRGHPQSTRPGWFMIGWGYEEDYYAPARKIAGSQYEKPFVAVPPGLFEEVLDFADRYDFRLTPGAMEAVEQARVNQAAALIADIKPKPSASKRKIKAADLSVPAPMTEPDAGIDEDLRDA
jgi:hypothetical protein